MRILVLNAAIVPPSKPGGTRHYMFAKYLRARHEVYLVASDVHYSSLKKVYEASAELSVFSFDGVDIHVVKHRPFGKGASRASRVMHWVSFGVKALRYMWRLPRPDVVVGSSPNLLQALAAERYARLRGVPFVLEIRDLWPEVLVELGGFSRTHPFVVLLGSIERYLYRRAAAVITLMEGSQPMLVQRGSRPEGIHVVPNGVDLDLVDAPDPAPAIVLDPERFNIVYTGSHGISNALDAVLDAARLVAKQGHADVQFTFVGDGENKAQLKARCRDEGIENVTFCDPIPKDRIYGVLRQADALVVNALNASLYDYGLSFNKIYDYMAVARPTVFAVPSNIMEISGGGITCTPDDAASMADAVVRLKHMSARDRQAMGQRARAYVEQNHNIARLAEVFETALTAAVTAHS